MALLKEGNIALFVIKLIQNMLFFVLLSIN